MPRCLVRVALIGWIALLLAGCSVPPLPPFTGGAAGTPTPAPAAVKETRTDTLFALRVGETARVGDAGLDVTFAGVMADERCPLNLQCFVSGPVRLALQVGSTGGATATLDVAVQTNELGFTDISTPDAPPGVAHGAWHIGVISVTPYPDAQRPDRPANYQVALVVLPAGGTGPGAGQGTQGQGAPAGETLVLRHGETGAALDGAVRVTFDAVQEDSRCPADVLCAWSGVVDVQVTVAVEGSAAQSVTLGGVTDREGTVLGPLMEASGPTEMWVAGYIVTLDTVLPYPARSDAPPAEGEYSIEVTVRPAG